MQLIKISKNLFFIIAIVSAPFLEFLGNNFLEKDIILSKTYYLLFIINLIFFLIALFFTGIILNKKEINTILIIGIIYWFFFKHQFFIKLLNQIDITLASYNSEIAFILIIFLIFFSIYFVIKKKKIFINFFIIFIILNIFYSSYLIFFKSLEKKNFNKINQNKISIIYNDINKNKKKNIYFFLLDGMMSLEKFKKNFHSDEQEFKNYIFNKDYIYLKNSKNLYGNTTHTLTAMFYLDEIFNNQNELKNKIISYYPTLLRKNYKTDLIYNLEKLNYNFKWIGNFFSYCAKFNFNYCLENEVNKKIDYYLVISFFTQTPAIQIVHKLLYTFGYDFDKKVLFKFNDGIGRFLKYLEKNKYYTNNSTFYFIHHMSPHWPYLNDSNCNYKKFSGKVNFEGYESSYKCVLKKISLMIEFLSKNDPDAFVVFQGDHSWEMSNISEQQYGDRKDIFNIIKLNDGCSLDQSINYNNVNTLRTILFCITGDKSVKFLNEN